MRDASRGRESCSVEEARSLLSSLLPSSIAYAALNPRRAALELPEVEARCVRGAVPKRWREFAAGRACARCALAQFGLRDAAIPRGRHGMPIWPPGFVGSISHCGDLALSAVARAAQVRGLGIDVEEASALPEELRRLVATHSERCQIAELGASPGADWFKILFSAKESLFKCHYSLSRRPFDFLDVELRLEPERWEFEGVISLGSLPRMSDSRQLRGRFRVGSRHVFTAVLLGASRSR